MPLYSAIETAINNNASRVVTLPREAMLGPVSDFIEGLEKAAETGSTALQHKQTPYSQVCEQRKADLKRFIDMFCTKAASDDLYFLYAVLARWADMFEYDEEVQPTSPIMSAFQFQMDHRYWVLVTAARHVEASKALIVLVGQGGWLAELLEWIANKGETISPCEVGKEAFRHQQAFDKALPAADAA